ncbi:MAG TPA: hypothetical protein VGN95_17975 [Pyrinomonadaceae bacterium]|jgi:hypothetical protein|nr:hypothetical protein [Pyrinomonadaceae bacterium]
MNVPGLLVEYLISGALALIWIYPLWVAPILKRYNLETIPPLYLPIFALGLYLIGMAIDFYAFILLRPIKYYVRGRLEKRYKINSPEGHGKTAARNAKLWLYSPELAKEVAMRSSRDRIARGAIINSVLATIFVLPAGIVIFLILTSSIMWAFFEYWSYSFEVKAELALDRKIENDSNKHRT